MKSIGYFLLVALLAAGCEQTVAVDVGYEAELAITSTFHPDQEVWTAVVSRTVPYDDESVGPDSIAYITDATVVVLNGGGETIARLHHTEWGEYVGSGPAPEPGQTYEIRVSAPGYEPARATSQVPGPVQGLQATFRDSTGIASDWRGERIQATYRVRFDDPARQQNYYRLSVLRRAGINESRRFTSPHPALPRESFRETIRGDGVSRRRHVWASFPDNTFAGERFDVLLHFSRSLAYSYSVRLDVLTEDLYRYHKSLARQIDHQDNPFSEPPILHSNVKGGAGIFAGFLRQQTEPVVLGDITPRRLAGRYVADDLDFRGDTYFYDVLNKGGAFTLTLRKDRTASGRLVVPAAVHPDGERIDVDLSGTYRVEKGMITFQFGEGTFVSEKEWYLNTNRYPRHERLQAIGPYDSRITAELEKRDR